MKRRILNKKGSILLPILIAFSIIALSAFMINRSGSIEINRVNLRTDILKARYVAEAGLNHAKWFLSFDCDFRTALMNIPFSNVHSYNVLLTDNSDESIHIESEGIINGLDPDLTTHFSETVQDDFRCAETVKESIYWTDGGPKVVRRAEFDGSGINDILTALNGLVIPKPLAIDSDNRKVYWGDGHQIFRADVDGSLMEEIVDCDDCDVSGLDIDPPNGFIYYTDRANNEVSRADLDGSNNTLLIDTFISSPNSLRIDLDDERLFFSDEDNREIKSARLDGSDLRTELSGVRAWALALDTGDEHIYYFDRNSRSVDRDDYGGGDLRNIMSLGSGRVVHGIDLHLSTDRIYCAANSWNIIQRVLRADLDGSNFETIITYFGFNKPWDLRIGPSQAIILPQPKGICWTEDGGANRKRVIRAEIDGTSIQSLVSSQKDATFIQFDSLTERLYWAGDKKIMSSTVKGADLDEVIDCQSASCKDVFGIALDPNNQHVYWADQGKDWINRVDYDGSDETNLIESGIEMPLDIDLDLINNKIYWSDLGLKTIKMSNLDGSNVQTVLSDEDGDPVEKPYAIAVDQDNSRLYWYDHLTKIIYRSTLTGSGVTTIIGPANMDEVRSLTLDMDNGKLYWVDMGLKQIKRANLNGSAVELVIDLTLGANDPPWGITIIPSSSPL